jgi:hypothetical protein
MPCLSEGDGGVLLPLASQVKVYFIMTLLRRAEMPRFPGIRNGGS